MSAHYFFFSFTRDLFNLFFSHETLGKRFLKAKSENLYQQTTTMFLFQARNDREKMGWDKEYLHYTNEDNPYGDSNLTSTFRWQKKLEKDGIDKVDDHELQKMQRAKFEEQKRELEKVKQRRLDRERER